MTRAEAVKKLQRIFGKKALYRVREGAPNKDQRQEAYDVRTAAEKAGFELVPEDSDAETSANA